MIDRSALTPQERAALTVAWAQVQRGEFPMPACATVCVAALARIAGKPVSEPLTWDTFWQRVRETNWNPTPAELAQMLKKECKACGGSGRIVFGNMGYACDECEAGLCDDCPREGYPTDKTRCVSCPRRHTPSAK